MRIISTGNIGIGTSDPKTLLHVDGKILIHNGAGGVPAIGLYGGDSTRLISWPGSATESPYSFGINSATLWYGVPSNANHVFYTGTNERMRIIVLVYELEQPIQQIYFKLVMGHD
jgi:hypothetical protein